jgi:hypothetical protein
VGEWRFGVSFSLTFRMLPFWKVEGGALNLNSAVEIMDFTDIH